MALSCTPGQGSKHYDLIAVLIINILVHVYHKYMIEMPFSPIGINNTHFVKLSYELKWMVNFTFNNISVVS